jgi:hypothetical protein
MMSLSKLRPSTFGPVMVVNHFEYNLSSMLFKGGFIVPSREAVEPAGYAVRLSSWYLLAQEEGYIQPLEGCKLTVDTPAIRIDYFSSGRVKVSTKQGQVLRDMRKSAQMSFDFSVVLRPSSLAHYLIN